MKTLILIILLLIPASAYAGPTIGEIGLELAYFAGNALDYGQTKAIAKDPRYYEKNPILGKYPSIAEVNRFFIINTVAHTAISVLLPRRFTLWGIELRPRMIWQITTVAVKFDVTRRNYNLIGTWGF